MSQDSSSGSTSSLQLGDEHGSFTPWRPPTRSTGRGGAGNIHTTVTPREGTSSSASGSLDSSSFISSRKLRLLSLPRTGNTKPRSKSLRKAASFGRGGAGNSRERKRADSGSKTPPLPDITHLEQQYLLARETWRPHQPATILGERWCRKYQSSSSHCPSCSDLCLRYKALNPFLRQDKNPGKEPDI